MKDKNHKNDDYIVPDLFDENGIATTSDDGGNANIFILATAFLVVAAAIYVDVAYNVWLVES